MVCWLIHFVFCLFAKYFVILINGIYNKCDNAVSGADTYLGPILGIYVTNDTIIQLFALFVIEKIRHTCYQSENIEMCIM